MAVPPGVSNPQGAGGPHFLGATPGIGLGGFIHSFAYTSGGICAAHFSAYFAHFCAYFHFFRIAHIYVFFDYCNFLRATHQNNRLRMNIFGPPKIFGSPKRPKNFKKKLKGCLEGT
jgi:hypothetical protein